MCLPGKIDFDIDLLTVAAARRDQAIVLVFDAEHVGRKAVADPWRPAPRRNRRSRRCAEPGPRPGWRTSISAPTAASKVSGSNSRAATFTATISSTPASSSAGISCAGHPTSRATATLSPARRSGLRRGDQLECHGPQFAAPMLGNDQNPAHAASPGAFADDLREPRWPVPRLLPSIICARPFVRHVHAPDARERPALADMRRRPRRGRRETRPRWASPQPV